VIAGAGLVPAPKARINLATTFSPPRLLRPDESGLAMTKGVSLRAKRGNLGGGNSLHGEIGNNCLPQGDATIITGYLPMGKNLETAAFQ